MSASPVPPSPQPLSREEAAAIVTRLRAVVKVMPKPRIVTRSLLDRQKAGSIVAKEIVASIQRCEALERAATDAKPTEDRE